MAGSKIGAPTYESARPRATASLATALALLPTIRSKLEPPMLASLALIAIRFLSKLAYSLTSSLNSILKYKNASSAAQMMVSALKLKLIL